jgi:hypothetical protein
MTDDTLVVGIQGSAFQLELAEKKDSRELIEQLAAETLGKHLQVRFKLLATGAGTAPRDAATGASGSEPPDPFVQDTLNIFNGRIVDPEARG